MKKKYFEPETELILLMQEDILTESVGNDHGGGPGEDDDDWDFVNVL